MEPSYPFFSRVSDTSAQRETLLYDPEPSRPRDRYWLHILLFVVTLISTVFTGAQFAGRFVAYEQADVFFSLLGLPVSWPFIADGLIFAVSLLGFLTVHEFGHYFAARRHRVDTSLPYFIPSPLIGIGTLGAVIRIREPIPSLRKLFDIGAAGPLAGFVVALGVLFYALATLPSPLYLQSVGGHEEILSYIQQFGTFPPEMPDNPDLVGQRLVVGQTLLYWFLSQFFANVPPMYEMYHYPMLFAAWLGLFFTALNLMPVGQLDGGHILYALVGPKWHGRLARGFVLLLLLSVSIGFVDEGVDYFLQFFPQYEPQKAWLQIGQWFVLAGYLYFMLNRIFKRDLRQVGPALFGLVLIAALAQFSPALTQFGWMGWWVWSLLLIFLIKVDHPPVLYREPLTPTRRALGILSLIIFVLCFSIKPLYIV
ncbi:MAG TPA: site-2 protease family protein [Rhodothermales bacterium]|nr:site-2 protease family protein [Rhodothermales bacterium]